jgi:outer membrane cobalamin receptor
VNNALSANNYFLNAEMLLSKKMLLHANGQYYEAESGLPGRASAQNDQATREDKRRMAGVQLTTNFSNAIMLTTAIRGSRSKQHFINRENGLAGFETTYTNDLYRFSSTIELQPLRYSHITSGIEAQADEINGQDIMRPDYSFGKAHRTAAAWFVSTRQSVPFGLFSQLHPFTIDAVIRYDHTQTGSGGLFVSNSDSAHIIRQWSPKIGAGIGVGSALSMTLYGSYGRSFSLPDLYSLFWKGDVRSQGNPYLRPERAEHSEVIVRARYEHRLVSVAASLSYFHSSVQDLIVWQAGFADVWRPENIAGARITGTERSAEIKLFDNLLQFSVSNTELVPLNRTPGLNSYNKDLTYRPRSITKTSARINWRGFYTSYAVRWVDRSYALPSNTRWYNAYQLDDLAFGGEKIIGGQWNLHTDVRIDNLWDQSYVLVQHFPMARREWQIGIGIDYLINQHKTKQSTDK